MAPEHPGRAKYLALSELTKNRQLRQVLEQGQEVYIRNTVEEDEQSGVDVLALLLFDDPPGILCPPVEEIEQCPLCGQSHGNTLKYFWLFAGSQALCDECALSKAPGLNAVADALNNYYTP